MDTQQPPTVTDEDMDRIPPLRDGDALLISTLVGMMPHLGDSGLPYVVLSIDGLGRFAMPAHYARLIAGEVGRIATQVEGMSALMMIGELHGWSQSQIGAMIDNFNVASETVRTEVAEQMPTAHRDTVIPNPERVARHTASSL